MSVIEKWGMFEVAVNGSTDRNPFTDHTLKGVFKGKNETITADGFYDGDGIYKVRFMPSFEGEYTYTVSGSCLTEPVCGTFTVTTPTGNNHGPMRVAKGVHFVYEDGTPYYSMGTTCYAWAHQPEETIQNTLRELDKGYFNKMRFCVFPKHYIHTQLQSVAILHFH